MVRETHIPPKQPNNARKSRKPIEDIVVIKSLEVKKGKEKKKRKKRKQHEKQIIDERSGHDQILRYHRLSHQLSIVKGERPFLPGISCHFLGCLKKHYFA